MADGSGAGLRAGKMNSPQLKIGLQLVLLAKGPVALQHSNQHVLPGGGGYFLLQLLHREGQQVLPPEPGSAGEHVRSRPQLQVPDHVGKYKVHLLQLLPLLCHSFLLEPQLDQYLGCVLPLKAAAYLL